MEHKLNYVKLSFSNQAPAKLRKSIILIKFSQLSNILPFLTNKRLGSEVNLKWPNVRVVSGTENISDVRQTAFVLGEIDEITTLEINLDKNQTLVMLAKNGLEETASTQNLFEDEIVSGWQVMKIILRS